MKKPTPIAKNGITGRQDLLHIFTVDHTSEDGTRYYGKFTTKKLSIADLASLGVRKAQLNGGMYHDPTTPGMGVDSQTDDFNAMIAHLEIALQSWPEWWNLDQITDGDLLAAVFEEVAAHENTFLRRRREANKGTGSDGSGEGDSSEGSQESAARRVASAVVDQEVQDSLEP